MERSRRRQEVLAGHFCTLGSARVKLARRLPTADPIGQIELLDIPAAGSDSPAAASCPAALAHVQMLPWMRGAWCCCGLQTPVACSSGQAGKQPCRVVSLRSMSVCNRQGSALPVANATSWPPQAVGDVCMGSVLGLSSQAALECRMGALLGGLPVAVPVHVVNRQCGSGEAGRPAGAPLPTPGKGRQATCSLAACCRHCCGPGRLCGSGTWLPTVACACCSPLLRAGLQAVAEVSSSIRAGYYSIGIAGGEASPHPHCT